MVVVRWGIDLVYLLCVVRCRFCLACPRFALVFVCLFVVLGCSCLLVLFFGWLMCLMRCVFNVLSAITFVFILCLVLLA